MVVTYFDSSLLLCVLLNEARAEAASVLWDLAAIKVSSILLPAECYVNLRRHFLKIKKSPPAGWMEERMAVLEQSVADATIRQVDAGILEVLKRHPELSECRSLDAIHLATALHFREHSDGEFFLASFDERMRHAAVKLGIKTLPEGA